MLAIHWHNADQITRVHIDHVNPISFCIYGEKMPAVGIESKYVRSARQAEAADNRLAISAHDPHHVAGAVTHENLSLYRIHR